MGHPYHSAWGPEILQSTLIHLKKKLSQQHEYASHKTIHLMSLKKKSNFVKVLYHHMQGFDLYLGFRLEET